MSGDKPLSDPKQSPTEAELAEFEAWTGGKQVTIAEIVALVRDLRRARAFVVDVLGYMERGDARWYGEPMKDRARALLLAVPDAVSH